MCVVQPERLKAAKYDCLASGLLLRFALPNFVLVPPRTMLPASCGVLRLCSFHTCVIPSVLRYMCSGPNTGFRSMSESPRPFCWVPGRNRNPR